MSIPKLICGIEAVAKAAASAAWKRAYDEARADGWTVSAAITFADLAKTEKLAEFQPTVDVYNKEHANDR